MQINVTNTGAIFGTFLGVFINGLLYVMFREVGRMVQPELGIAMAIAIALQVIIFYIIATITVKQITGTEEAAVTALMRGLLIGVNSFANFGLWYLILSPASETAALTVGGVVAGVNLLSSIGPLSQWEVYQGVLGWMNWLMPMSWFVVALGLSFVLLSLLVHPIGMIARSAFLRVGVEAGKPLAGRVFTVDWATGTLSLYSGWIANLNYAGTAFNMGNFAFVHRNSSHDYRDHEAGHTLNLAAFGSIFHLVGALDENLPVIGSGANAFAEVLAESNDHSGGHTRLLMWK